MPDRSTRSGKTTEQKSLTAYVLIMGKAATLSSGIWTKKQQVQIIIPDLSTITTTVLIKG